MTISMDTPFVHASFGRCCTEECPRLPVSHRACSCVARDAGNRRRHAQPAVSSGGTAEHGQRQLPAPAPALDPWSYLERLSSEIRGKRVHLSLHDNHSDGYFRWVGLASTWRPQLSDVRQSLARRSPGFASSCPGGMLPPFILP